MADTKITALTALTAADPINDVIPIVDVSDTTMAASGTTKKISVNNILGASGTATLASATITGDLTVDTSTLKVDSTNNRVIVGHTSGSAAFQVTNAGAAGLEIQPTGFSSAPLIQSYNRSGSAYTQLTLDASTIVHALSGTTAMTLNSTGLGIGDAPASGEKLTVLGSIYLKTANKLKLDNASNNFGASIHNIGASAQAALAFTLGATQAMTLDSTGLGIGVSPSSRLDVANTATPVIFSMTLVGAQRWQQIIDTTAGNWTLRDQTGSIDALIVKAGSGNLGVGVTPSAWGSGYKSVQVNEAGGFAGKNDGLIVAQNCYFNGTNWVNNRASTFSSRYDMNVAGNGVHAWYVYNASFGTVGNTIPFTQAMTLTAAGEFLVGTTSTSVASGGVVTYGSSAGQLAIGHATGTGSGNAYAGFQYAGTEIGSITQNGTTGVLYNIVSDYRLKESVVPLSGGLARVNALKPSVYNWKSDGSTGEGFLAHELAEVVPFAVSGEKDAVNADGTIKPQGIDMSRIVPILVAAIQELTAEVNALKNA